MSKVGKSASRAAVMAAPTRSYPAEIIPTIEQTGWDESMLRRCGFPMDLRFASDRTKPIGKKYDKALMEKQALRSSVRM